MPHCARYGTAMLRRLLTALALAACATPPATTALSSTAPAGDPRFDAELSATVYPFPVRFLALSSQREQLRMAYMDVAAPQPNGHTVVLLHGKNFNASYWEPTIRFLVARGYSASVAFRVLRAASAADDENVE